ncbi:MAG: hypothetical protein HN613_02295 [Gammaproteobacteria bacterium]|jgi:(5-formylfuran-3-yl)methyl phosphate synthase|nr:hypothetical protein [Gammaproteobacteria bacterium]MBT7603539.1 hypothetical protein [Gammaproteobacteria bacterium]
MSKVLASIKDLSEAKLLVNTDIDIIDLKDPAKGALGKLNTNDIKNIVDFINKKKLVSSTIGDLPNDKLIISKNVNEVSETDVDFIKIGVYEKKYIKTLSQISCSKKLIAVFFADKFLPSRNDMMILKSSGFYGLMIDTANKKSGNLFSYITYNDINKFLKIAVSLKLLTGIAGSIDESHINDLLQLNPNYMGFRGALCENKEIRNSNISINNVKNIINKINDFKNIKISA